MKTKYLFIAAIGVVTLASCADDVFVGDNSPNVVEQEATNTEGMINFGGGFKAVTRANSVGAAAADLLGSKFYVAGVKGDGTGSNQTDVFKTYSVVWEANSAGKTESNTSDWEYVGKTHDFGTATSITSQTIKYWDYSKTAYDFCAYSIGKGITLATAATTDDNKIYASAISYANAGTSAYTLQGTRTGLQKCYITNMKTVPKASYGNEVTLEFRSLACQVRMALYETVPGYSVQNVHFYVDDATDVANNTTISNTNATLFGTNAFNGAGTYTVTFPTIGSSNSGKLDYNKAHVSFAGTDADKTSNESFGALNYTSGKLGTTSTAPSFAGTASPYYVTMLPNETGVVLEMRVNYELIADDGGGEIITVHGAKAFVPAIYAKWLPNYAYTYLFKISDNTNGWTDPSGTDPAGLYPITFDAIVLDPIDASGEQTTITTVAMPSITTYQKGDLYNTNDEYAATAGTSDSIYVQVMGGYSDLKADLDTKGALYIVTNSDPATTTISEATVMDALNIQVSNTSGTILGRNGLTLTPVASTNYQVADGSTTFGRIPAIDGNYTPVAEKTAARFKGVANTTYAYVYDATPTPAPGPSYIYSAESFASGDGAPTGWGTLYWDNPNGTGSAITTAWSSITLPNTYYRQWEDQNKTYSVKVIKVI